MFISLDIIREAITELEYIHPFYGITFLVCKKERLPIGKGDQLSIDTLETDFLDTYYKPDEKSEYFFRLFRISDKLKLWVHRKKYASSTLQSIRTRSAFNKAFIHDIGSSSWGWQPQYIGVLQANLSYNLKNYKGEKIPVFLLAAWLYRKRDWNSNVKAEDIIDTFLAEFNISEAEYALFDLNVDKTLFEKPLFQKTPATWETLKEYLGTPPDSEPETGENLALLELQGVGPMPHLKFEPAERLNLLTGDNGLGKSFLLECSWWALTGRWTSIQSQATPRTEIKQNPQISFQIGSKQGRLKKVTATYLPERQRWTEIKDRPQIPGLVIYARVDGSFAIWNPLRDSFLGELVSQNKSGVPSAAISSDDVWNGIPGQIEGLLRDWIKWQNSSAIEEPFDIFKRVLSRLSPPDLGDLEPGEPSRLAFESTDIPTLKHSYGEVPIIHSSAAVRRVLALSYLIAWTWNEHLVYSRISQSKPQRRMVVMIDEIESHLHPLWQRTVLPALLDAISELSDGLQTQFFIATHSPLVMASAESIFSDELDGLFHVDLTQNGEVEFKEMDFIRQGSVDAWLTSKVFDLRHARSLPAEQAIEEAKELQKLKSPSKEEIAKVSKKLLQTLAADDEFWSRWNYFAETHGIEL